MINFLYNAVSSIGAVACKVRLVLKDHESFGIALTNRKPLSEAHCTYNTLFCNLKIKSIQMILSYYSLYFK